MSTYHHDPLVPNVDRANTTDLNAPLAQLDEAISERAPLEHEHVTYAEQTDLDTLKETAIGVSYPTNQQPASDEIYNIVFPFAVTFPADLTGSVYHAQTAPDAEVTVDFKKNGSSFGSMTVSASGTTASFSAASSTSFSAGDRLSFCFPSSQDLSWAGMTIILKGTKVV
jgi:hypothetical protein